MPFPYDAGDLAAIDRLANFYNGADYDASTNPGGMGRGGHRVNFENALADAARVGAANSAAAVAAGASATNAGNSATAAAASAARLIGSSASSVAIGTGSKAFVTQAGKFFAPGAFVMVYSAANPTVNYMTGQVSAYSGTDLTVDATVTKGSGSFADWVIAIAGAPGGPGAPGLIGPTGPTPDIMVTFSDGVTDSDPGNGILKFSNALPGSTTQLFVDNLDRYGTSIASWLDSFDDSTNTALRGTVKLVQVSDPTKYARFAVVGAVVDGTGYRKIPVSHVLSSGTFTNGAILAIDFVRTGDKGLDGDGAGDVIGPAVSVDNHVALFNGVTGKLLKSGGALAPVATNGLASSVTVTPTGSLGASSVQAALAELDDEKQPLDPSLTALSGAGVTAAGLALLGAADVPAQRAALGQQKVKVLDQVVTGSPVTGIEIDLLGLDEFWIELIAVVNPAVADFSIGWQTSLDGVTYDAGASDYYFQVEYFTGSGPAGFNSGYSSRGEMHAGNLDTGTPSTYAKFTLQFSRGKAGVNPRLSGKATGWNGSAYAVTGGFSERASPGAASHLRLFANVALGLGIGTRCIVEGC